MTKIKVLKNSGKFNDAATMTGKKLVFSIMLS